MGGKIYYGAPSLEETKAIALEYQRTKDKKLFWRFLHRFELLGFFTCWWMRKRHDYLKKVEKADLEQTAYIGVHKAFNTIKPVERPEYIPLHVIAYVKRELTTTYHYLLDEQNYYSKRGEPDHVEATSEIEDLGSITATYNPTGSTDLEDYKRCPGISDREADLIQLIYVTGWTQTEVAQKMGVSPERVGQLLGRVHTKLKTLLSGDVGDKGNGAILDKGWFGGGMLDLWMKSSSRSVFFLLVLFFLLLILWIRWIMHNPVRHDLFHQPQRLNQHHAARAAS